MRRSPTSNSIDDRPSRHDRGLELIAAFKITKAVLLLIVGLGAIHLVRNGLAVEAAHWLANFSAGLDRRLTRRALAAASGMTPDRLEVIGVASLIYAALYTVEGVGLWLERTWAEYLTVIATASVIPLEVHAVVRHVSLPRVIALVFSAGTVGYLIFRLRRPRRATTSARLTGHVPE